MPETLLNNLRKLCLSERATTTATMSLPLSSTMLPMAEMVRCVDVDRERLKRQLSCIPWNPKCVYETGKKSSSACHSVTGTLRITWLVLSVSHLLPVGIQVFFIFFDFLLSTEWESEWTSQVAFDSCRSPPECLHSMGIEKIMSAIWHPSVCVCGCVAYYENRLKTIRKFEYAPPDDISGIATDRIGTMYIAHYVAGDIVSQ